LEYRGRRCTRLQTRSRISHSQRYFGIGSYQDCLERDIVVIAVGGGGIPVILENGEVRGIEAVIDKDRASALLAAKT